MNAQLISKDEFATALKLNRLKMDAIAQPLMKIIKLDELNKLYATVHSKTGIEFIDEVLEKLGINIEIDEKDLKNIPLHGSFIALANHPFGGIDGLIMLKILATVRPDFKLIANFILKKVYNIEDMLIAVNPFENIAQYKYNISGLRQTLDFIERGYPIGIFPAGEVSSMTSPKIKVTDKEWNPVVARLIQKAKNPVLPIYFHGTNSYMFNLLGLLHPTMRTVRLPSELLNKRGATIKVRIGKPIEYKELKPFEDNSQMLRFLRTKTYGLGSALEVDKFFSTPVLNFPKKAEEIIAPIDTALLEAEILKLRKENVLLEQQNLEVFVAGANHIPNILKEIGRLREVTFREVGEGTNKSIDLDEFDLYYHHLFIWDKEAKQIVGSYRVGKGKEIYEKYRKKGFYIHTLFKIRNEFVPILEESLELGRSFIRKEYQQKPMPLFTLWKGILQYMKNNPGYRYLIGPVSISNNFSKASQNLIIHYIRQYCYDETLAEYVQPRKEFNPGKSLFTDSEILLKSKPNHSLNDLDSLISDIEPMRYKVPVLLKKYIKQNGKIISFNVDPKFNNSLDGFLILDVKEIPDETIKMLE